MRHPRQTLRHCQSLGLVRVSGGMRHPRQTQRLTSSMLQCNGLQWSLKHQAGILVLLVLTCHNPVPRDRRNEFWLLRLSIKENLQLQLISTKLWRKNRSLRQTSLHQIGSLLDCHRRCFLHFGWPFLPMSCCLPLPWYLLVPRCLPVPCCLPVWTVPACLSVHVPACLNVHTWACLNVHTRAC